MSMQRKSRLAILPRLPWNDLLLSRFKAQKISICSKPFLTPDRLFEAVTKMAACNTSSDKKYIHYLVNVLPVGILHSIKSSPLDPPITFTSVYSSHNICCFSIFQIVPLISIQLQSSSRVCYWEMASRGRVCALPVCLHVIDASSGCCSKLMSMAVKLGKTHYT